MHQVIITTHYLTDGETTEQIVANAKTRAFAEQIVAEQMLEEDIGDFYETIRIEKV